MTRRSSSGMDDKRCQEPISVPRVVYSEKLASAYLVLPLSDNVPVHASVLLARASPLHLRPGHPVLGHAPLVGHVHLPLRRARSKRRSAGATSRHLSPARSARRKRGHSRLSLSVL